MKHFRFENCAYFITTNTFKRGKIFIDHRYAQIVEKAVLFGSRQNWYQLIGYVVMPDHLYLILIPERKNIPGIMKTIKGFTARKINLLRKVNRHVWQERYHDLAIDKIAIVRQKLRYIEENPVRAGLVENATDYQFSSAGKYAELELSSLY
jgi:putative transposase